MCGCTKNIKASTPLSTLKNAQTLVAEGVAAWYLYTGKHDTTRRGEATNTRYAVARGKCVLLALEDYQAFYARNPNEFIPCVKAEVIQPEQAQTQTSDVVVLPEVTKSETIPSKTAPEVQTISSIADITTLTVANAIPIIREAHAYTLDVWEKQEKAGQGRVMILTAIDKRRQEIVYESQHA